MNVLVVGGGSIGKRHTKNLIAIDDVSRVFVSTRNNEFISELKEETSNNKRDKIQCIGTSFSDLIKDETIDFAIIANETGKHIETSLPLAEKGIHLIIEKPLDHSLLHVQKFQNSIKKNNLLVLIAYNLRFLGVMDYLKEQLSKKIIGDLYFAHIEVGQWFPSCRPGQDYRDNYRAKQELGGGAALDLSHEIDYMRYLFGDPIAWKTVKAKVSRLEMSSDDLFEGIYQYNNGFVCHAHMDFLQHEKTRKIRIVGSEGVIICDFVNKTLEITTKKDSFSYSEAKNNLPAKDMFDIPKTYKDELRHFISCLKEEKEPCITVDDGAKVLMLLEDGRV